MMMCPYCQKDMVLGYVQCRDGLNWTPKLQLVASLSFLGRGRVSLQNGASDDLISSSAVYAYHCDTCKFVMIPYGDSPLLSDKE